MRNAEVHQTLTPAVPFYEAMSPTIASPPLTATIWTDVSFNNLEWCTSDFIQNVNDGSVKVVTSGLYLVEYDIAIRYAANPDSAVIESRFKINGNAMERCMAIMSIYSTGSVNEYGYLHLAKVLYLKAGDVILPQIRSSKTGAIIYLDPNNGIYYGRFAISFIPTGGWNNGFGGKIINMGIRR